jgi:hypothetical protein
MVENSRGTDYKDKKMAPAMSDVKQELREVVTVTKYAPVNEEVKLMLNNLPSKTLIIYGLNHNLVTR